MLDFKINYNQINSGCILIQTSTLLQFLLLFSREISRSVSARTMSKAPITSQNFDIGWIHKQAKCWVFFPNKQEGQIYLRGNIQKINPLSFNKGNSIVRGILQNGIQFQTKAYLLQKCRQSRSIERDLIQMDIINDPQVLNQLKKRFEQRKIHTYLWNSLIIVNPFELIEKTYGQNALQYYYENILLKGQKTLTKLEPHIYGFMFNILREIKQIDLIHVLSISGQSGSGKTQTNKQCLRAISYGCQKQKLKSQKHASNNNLQLKILQCDPILEAFGNAKTVKNDNSSRFGKLISIKINQQSMSIQHFSIRNYFLQKSRIISQASGQRNFHIFYLFLKFMSQPEKNTYKLKGRLGTMKFQDFNYISQKFSYNNNILISQKQMWNDLLQAFKNLDFKKQQINQIWSIISSVLLLGNIDFDGTLQTQNDPCQISNPQLVTNISHLLKIKREQLEAGLVFNRKIIAGQLMHIPLTVKQCEQGRDSMAKAIYQGLFLWIVEQLNNRVNYNKNQADLKLCKQIKLLDIYGFQVFEKNSFEQLCVNFTNEKIHQIYLEQVFIHEKKILKMQGLQANIVNLNFTDNYRIIELLESSTKSIYNLLDQSCTLNVKDTDFLSNVRKSHQTHEHFPVVNSHNIRNSFIIKHTPGQIQYMVEGFRDKNKDLLRQDIVHKLSQSESSVLRNIFQIKLQSMKHQSTKKYLGIKIRRQVKQLINQMSTNTNLHFVRCIKPNEEKKAFTFVDRVCYNQIKYLGILDTIQMRKQSYHVRILYLDFYRKFGILQEGGLPSLIAIQNGDITNNQARELSMKLMTNNIFTNHKLQYLFGRQKVFMKMSTKNFLDVILKQKTLKIQYAATIIKASFRMTKKKALKNIYKKNVPKVQNAVRNYLNISKLSKKKKAVLTIQIYWIKYCHQFFLRKRRKYVISLQKYIKAAVQVQKQRQKASNMLKIQKFVRSAIQTHKHVNILDNFINLKQVIKNDIYERIWSKIQNHNEQKIKIYLKTFAIRKRNSQILCEGENAAVFRQSIRYIQRVQLYAKGFLNQKKLGERLQNIKKIQNYIRMSRIRTKYNSLKQNVTRIQRSWRVFYNFKQKSMIQTERYFQSKMQGQRQRIQSNLFRKIQDMNNRPSNFGHAQSGIENVLRLQQKVKRDKIGLFYYLFDFDMLCPLDYIYPQQSWVQNYCQLYKQSIQRGNPIQYIDVSNTHTICATINKIYQWGQIREENNLRTQKYYQSFPTPSGRIGKVKACDGFTIIETQDPQQLLIMGDQRQYEESSIKEWSTLTDSYVLLNGVILTLKQNTLAKLAISQKVTNLSCGMAHVLCKTSLKKVYSWGENKMGQLGHGNFRRLKEPTIIEFFNRHKIAISQMGATAYGSVILDTNCKVWWFGSNGTIRNQPIPKEAFIPLKSEYIDNTKKYSVVRIIPRWSKSISLIGLTIAIYDGAFKSTQTAIRKKCLQNLMAKWAQDIQTINPPYVATISGNFSQKHMFFKKPVTGKKPQNESILSYRQIKDKLYNQVLMIQHAENKLLSTIRGEYSARSNYANI